MADNNDSNLALEIVIRDVKLEFRELILKRKPLIQKLGNALENVVSNNESICEEIKNILKEEIAQKIISARLIESYCSEKWKHKTRPELKKKAKSENEVSSFSQIPDQVSQQHGQILVDHLGNSTFYKKPPADMQTSNETSDIGKKFDKPSKNEQSDSNSIELPEEPDHSRSRFSIAISDIWPTIMKLVVLKEDTIWFDVIFDKNTSQIISVNIGEKTRELTDSIKIKDEN